MVDFLLIALVLVASCLLTGVLRFYALKRSMLDVPNGRSSHTDPTPRGGGLSFVLTFFVAIASYYYLKNISLSWFMALSGGGLLVAGIGFWDDHHHIPARWRILVHFCAASWVLFFLRGFPPLPIGGVVWNFGGIGYLIGLIFLVWLLNLFNFMDGIDGIAAVEAISVAGSAALIMFVNGERQTFFPLVIFAAGCLGFLIWNWPPAKIFMGDVGSGFLGFILGTFAIFTATNNSLSLWSWFILLGIFLVDATITLVRRILRGERFYEAHRSHAYQHAARRFKSHKKITLAVFFINIIWLLPLAWITARHPEYGGFITILALMPLIVLAFQFDAGKIE